MEAQSSVRAGRLQEALDLLQEQVRRGPADVSLRVFLFQLLSVLGQWERAATQLDVAAGLDAKLLLLAEIYRPALESEKTRSEVFAGRQTPVVLGEPPEWIGAMIQACHLDGMDQPKAAAALRQQTLESISELSGTMNDKKFQWLADADMRLGPVFEVVIDRQYYWLPMHQVKEVRIEAPQDLRDLVWVPVQFTFMNGGCKPGLIPTRYSGSECSEDSLILMSRKTEWIDTGFNCYFGVGQRMLASDQENISLLEVRHIVYDRGLNDSAEVG